MRAAIELAGVFQFPVIGAIPIALIPRVAFALFGAIPCWLIHG